MVEKNKKAAKKGGSKTVQTVRSLIERSITDAGYVLWDIDYYKEGSCYNLLVAIEKPSRQDVISIEDCEIVTRLINPILDEADPIQDSYTLEVSRVGPNRVLKTPEQMNMFLGSPVSVSLYAPINGTKTVKGILHRCENGDIEILSDTSEKIVIESGKYSTVKLMDDNDF